MFLKCYKQEHKSEEKQKEHTDFEKKEAKTDGYEVLILCASRRFHEYKTIWVPKLGQKLIVKQDKSIAFDLHAMRLYHAMIL